MADILQNDTQSDIDSFESSHTSSVVSDSESIENKESSDDSFGIESLENLDKVSMIIQALENDEEVKISDDGSLSSDVDIPIEQPPSQLI